MATTISSTQSALPLLFASSLSSYGLFLCYQNITRLQQYEKTSEKAAEWSNAAAQRLHKTRTTQASGTASLIFSLLTSLTLLTTSLSPNMLATSSIANALVLLATRTHMAGFWNDKVQTRVPFVEKFNDAVRGSETVVILLGTLSLSWGVAGAAWAAVSKGWIGGLGGVVAWSVSAGLRVAYVMQSPGVVR